MAQNDIDDVLDHLRRIKSTGGDLSSVKINQIEKLEMHLRFLRSFIKCHHVLLPCSLVNLTKNAKSTVKILHRAFNGIPDEHKPNLNLERLVSLLLEFSEGNTSSSYKYELNDSDLSEYMDHLGKNLNDVLMCLKWKRSNPYIFSKEIHQSVLVSKQVKIIQKKMRFLRYLYATEINGYVGCEKLEGLETRIQFMADNVGQFCLDFWVNVTESKDDRYIWRKLAHEDEDDTNIDEDEDDTNIDEDEDETNIYENEDDTNIDEDEDDTYSDHPIFSKPPYLLCLIVLVELEINGELKASKFRQSRAFKEKKLSKRFSHHLHSLLMYVRKKKLKNFPNCVSARNIDVAIECLLVFLNADLASHVINSNWLNEIMEKVGAIASDVLYVVQKLLSSPINKDDTSKILEKTKDLMVQVETYYKSLKFTPSQFPTVGGLNFLDSLLRRLNEMSESKSSLDFLMKPLFGNLVKELSSLTSILEKELSSLSSIFKDVLKDLQRRTINLAYEAEVAIDAILAQYDVFWHIFCSLPTILKEIKQINEEVTEMWSADVALKPRNVVEPSKHLPTRHINHVSDEKIVGFEIAAEKLIGYLTQGTRELDVIPIVGMGGQGKTTCARMLYNNDIIVSHFDVRAWCIISQTYNRIEILQDVFCQVTGSKGDKNDVPEMLKRELREKRYLIVLDDMWDGMAWDDLSLCFPDVGNRSRIVVTTRLEKVGECVKHHTDLYFLPFLTPDESLKLLQKKVFQQEDCPPELQDVSLAVAKRCKGLPLVVILVAGIIKKRKMEESWWNDVKDALFDYLDLESISRATMQLSFDNLPDCLKPCLLYMGMFPEDARISVSKLISLWIAEGFMQNSESGRLEETAEDYLMDLISSNMVMVSWRRYNGKVEYCQVHDVVLHFCLEKSREEKFMLAVKGYCGQFQPSEWKESRVSFSFSKKLSKFASLGSKTRKPIDKHLRSFRTTNHSSKASDDFRRKPISWFREVRLLKVLDLSSFRVKYFSSATLKGLIHLKYLAVFTEYEFHFHPESHLPHLETLIVICYRSVSVLPEIFWKMEKLRHVDISGVKFDLENKKQGIFEESSKLENLRILRRRVEFPIDRADVLLGRCPNLQQLDIRFVGDKYSAEPFCLKLESLTQLQILHLDIDRDIILSELQLPSNLKELILSGTLVESSMSVLAGLPCLEYLKLQFAYRLKEWCLGDITFHKLKFLNLYALDMSRWDASEESFPLLETLVIDKCNKLEEIPDSFAEIHTLKQIKVHWCNESLEASALQIKEEVKENQGCDRIDLIIKKNRGLSDS